jgi:hypothetical protein
MPESRLTEKVTFEPPGRMLRRFCVAEERKSWYDGIIQEGQNI